MKRWFYYILYTLVATAFFLYYLFPSQTAEELVASYVKRSQPDVELQVAQIKPAIPPGLQFLGMGISYKQSAAAELERLVVRPDYLTMLADNKVFHFKGALYQGDIQGRIELTAGEQPYVARVAADFQNVRLDDAAALEGLLGRKILGSLNGEARYENSRGKEAAADIRLNLSNVAMELALPLINIGVDQMTFRSVDAVIAIDQQGLTLKQCKAVGEQADGELSGVIRFRRPLAKSLLDFKGTVKLHHSLLANMKNLVPGVLFQQQKTDGGNLPIKLYGTIEKPKISLR